MSRAWIVKRAYRCCSNYGCNNYNVQKKGTKTALNAATGEVTTYCPECEKTSEYQCSDWKEHRACKECGWVRNVTITIWPVAKGVKEEHFRQLCDACDLRRSASNHMYQANAMSLKAETIYARRRKLKLAPS